MDYFRFHIHPTTGWANTHINGPVPYNEIDASGKYRIWHRPACNGSPAHYMLIEVQPDNTTNGLGAHYAHVIDECWPGKNWRYARRALRMHMNLLLGTE
jgi:hypothetical protein